VRVLIIGGNRFVGYWLVWRLLARGDRVTLFNRGTLPDPFGDRVERIRGDRTGPDLARLLIERGHEIDAVVDFAAYKPIDVEAVVTALRARAAHYILISTGQVYLVREGVKLPAVEEDYAGPIIAEPSDADAHMQWSYGVEKRAAEDVLFAAHARSGFPFTTFRIPMVNGPRDYFRRIEGYLYRLLDGGPVILPGGGGHPTRHVYGPDVARAIADVLGRSRAFGQAYNLSQDEIPTLDELLAKLASMLGAPLCALEVPREEVIRAGLHPSAISPFSGKWMSRLDPTKAKTELAFTHRPFDQYLQTIVENFLAATPAEPPEGYSTRAAEIELAKRFTS
jgi:nucleoside-diphosphate-sugar epimerase